MCITCNNTECRGTLLHMAECTSSKTIKKSCYSKTLQFPLGSQKDIIYNIFGCMKSEDCRPFNETATLSNGQYAEIALQCCNKVMCNRYVKKVADKNDRPLNGMQCPGCLSINAKESCSSETMVRCHGEENHCVSYTGQLKTPRTSSSTVSFKGCATKYLCDLLTGASKDGTDILAPQNATEAECSCAEFPAKT
ncbi:phospholipase A2 inhibitor and Ly6/PLAUR domain-containing protein-like [Heteronotia binoei]|uniref:phospholipase A2 inhibitor and Ly6/PLAUR domain-containing protein-like n=1 Tax=Heteronotia binoei TaxID=13085 RepID=UPI002931D680|nr:phospholipase A2 inhibitor and Ly6/PLAUR domain-containing protein-like [Heteronotia binoei]